MLAHAFLLVPVGIMQIKLQRNVLNVHQAAFNVYQPLFVLNVKKKHAY